MPFEVVTSYRSSGVTHFLRCLTGQQASASRAGTPSLPRKTEMFLPALTRENGTCGNRERTVEAERRTTSIVPGDAARAVPWRAWLVPGPMFDPGVFSPRLP